jgi:hypothetical protein
MTFDDSLLSDLATEPRIVCWKGLDASTTLVETDRLSEWVDWASARYQLDYKTIPACWSQHGSLVEELSALRTLWLGCFEEDSAPSDPITFHRELEGALRRLREWNSRSGCTRTLHRAEPDI